MRMRSHTFSKDHPVLNYPNQITKADFEGWTQERGLYFPNQWSNEFTQFYPCTIKAKPKNKVVC